MAYFCYISQLCFFEDLLAFFREKGTLRDINNSGFVCFLLISISNLPGKIFLTFSLRTPRFYPKRRLMEETEA